MYPATALAREFLKIKKRSNIGCPGIAISKKKEINPLFLSNKHTFFSLSDSGSHGGFPTTKRTTITPTSLPYRFSLSLPPSSSH